MASSPSDKLPTPSPSQPNKLTASCHCGRVNLSLPSAPTKLNECRCTICYRYGALWAYYPRDEVLVTAEEPGLQHYVRTDEEARGEIGFYSCRHCGCLTHWWGQGGIEKRGGEWANMGVNARMLPEKAIEGVERKVNYE